jgi:hypothetical protein
MTVTHISHAATLAAVCVALAACASTANRSTRDREVTRSILHEDARLTEAYNNCELQTLHRMFAVNSTMYLASGRIQSPVDEARDTFCGKWQRQVVPGSLHVYPVNAAAAIQVGEQRICSLHMRTCDTRPSEFVAVWLFCDLHWQITELIRFPAISR